MSRPGDWKCRSCQHLNFQRRDSCQLCGDSKSVSVIGFDRLDFGIFGGRGVGGLVGGSGMFGAFGTSSGTSSVAGPDVRPGDWYCFSGNCGTHNFASRSTCFKCGAFKDELLSAAANVGGSGFDSDMPNRSTRGYGGFGMGGGGPGIIGTGGGGGGRSGWKSGDWICNRLGCNEHNFASRMECFRCNAPRGM